MKLKNLFIALLATMTLAGCNRDATPVISVDKMGIEVTPEQNREYSYSDKRSGYYYGRTHQPHFAEWYAGYYNKK